MPLSIDVVQNWDFAPIEQSYTKKDVILYALGLGFGADPLDPEQLRFVYEGSLVMAPTMPVVLAYPGFWLQDPRTGSVWQKVLHGEQGLTIHTPMPVEATVIGTTRIDDIIDKGAEKGALIYVTREIRDKETGALYATVRSTSFGRGDGGFGGENKPTPKPHPIPERAPDHSVDIATLPQAALIYRLSGDYNPLHADPEVGRAAGFEAPILHGLCTYGVASRAVLTRMAGGDPARLKRFDVRFSSPVYPGETIRTDIWDEGDGNLAFRSKVLERDIVVLNNGVAEVA